MKKFCARKKNLEIYIFFKDSKTFTGRCVAGDNNNVVEGENNNVVEGDNKGPVDTKPSAFPAERLRVTESIRKQTAYQGYRTALS